MAKAAPKAGRIPTGQLVHSLTDLTNFEAKAMTKLVMQSGIFSRGDLLRCSCSLSSMAGLPSSKSPYCKLYMTRYGST